MPKGAYGYVAEAQRDGKWVFLCPRCLVPEPKTDDPQVPALVKSDNGWLWLCPVCGYMIKDGKLNGSDAQD